MKRLLFPERLNILLDDIKKMLTMTGSTWISEDILKRRNLLSGMDQLIDTGNVVFSEKNGKYLFSLPEINKKENNIAKSICERIKHLPVLVPNEYIEKCILQYEMETGGKLDSIQADAVRMAINNDLCILTGGPGTGKTFTLNAITYVLKAIYPKYEILFTAPTGKAARRITESTGNPAVTLHKELGVTKRKMTPNIVQANAFIIDESSMLDIDIANALFEGIPMNCKLIIVGDSDQLPSVGAGTVLKDMIESEIVPVTKLLKTFRQKGESLIIDNMKNIRDGIMHLDVGKDFVITRPNEMKYSPQEFLLGCYIEKASEYGIDNVALLTPYRQMKCETGSERMNVLIQERINTSDKIITYQNKKFKLGDVVMQSENRTECANGDVGRIIDVGQSGIAVEYIDSTVEYSQRQLYQISLAYALSVHKSQGSEYKAVISCLLNDYGQMLQRNMFYTAVTRAKKDFILLGQDDAIKKSISTKSDFGRTTMLKEKIQQYYAYSKCA